jgi:predicted ATPase/anti-anti-sigma regulatory factor/tRNA A-37 threonylcarbamoyl transferase component Bud32
MQTEQYTILQTVHESSNSIIYRARHTTNGTSVILKAPAPKEPSTRDIARIIHQYELMKDVRLQGITNIFEMHHTDKSAFLVIEDFEGEALQESLLKKRFTIQEFLKIGITVADALAELHAAGVLHRDIKPHNILIQRESGQIKITDFGTAIPVQKHNQQRLASNQRLDGTLAYMSPEQTDRINRAVDHRSDLYSLGVTLYQILTGVRPFQSNEALELIHNHIARKPTHPQELDPSIPTVIADIVMKLLEKDPEDRYQGAKALKADLQLCLEQLNQNGRIEPFPLGRHGLGEAFHIPQKLYGREKELEVLLQAFERASLESPELLLISGYSGVGKSALVRESQQSIAQSYGYFSSGKFDQYKRDIPFNALLQAIEGLLGQILQEPTERRSELAARIKEHLGPSQASLVEIFPKLSELFEAELVEEQSGVQVSQTPLPQLLELLLAALARPEQPIVLFLDDLQWADLASLQFLQGFLKSQIKHMLLLGAYRDNEVTANHPLSLTIEVVAAEEGRFHKLELPALLSKDVSHLISDVCQADQSTLQPLVDTVYNKTMGNPFFINQFLTSLYQERLLFFESESQRWQWDIRQIEERYATANVIEFMTDKLKKLPATTQLALTYAACIGNRFEAQLLAKVRQQPLSETLKELEPAISEGLIMPLNTDFMLLKSYAQSMADDANSGELNSECRFLHDRIQHAAYSLMNDRAKSEIHIAIGQQLVKDLALEEQNEQIFAIVNQINLGLPSIEQKDNASRRQFAELNLKAGKQARGSAAYSSAMRYLGVSHQLLPADAWESDFELSKEVYSQLIYCETMLHNLDSAESYLHEMLNHLPEAHQRAVAYVELIDAYYSIHANQRAIDFGLKALASFGLHFPSDEAEQAALVVPSFERLREALNGRAIIELKDLPAATDQTQMALMQMMLTLGTVSYALAPMLFQLLSVESILINIKYGHNNVSAYAYNCYGIMLLGAFNDRKSANEYVQLALALNEKFPDPTYSGRIKVSAFGMLSHWFMPLPDAAESLRDAIDECLRTEDRLYTLFGIWYLIGLNFMLGRELQSSLNDMYRYFDFIYHSQNSTIQDNAFMLRHTIFALQGKTSNTANLNNEQFNEERFLEQEQAPHVIYIYHSYSATMHFWLENYQDAYRHSLATNPYQPAMVGQAWPMEVMFMRGIASCQLYDQANPQERATYLRQAEADVNALRDVLADYPETYLAKERLLSAEIARIQGDFLKADECYVAALEAAQQQSYLHIVALSNELLAKFYATRKHQRLLTVYINDAYVAYLKWGANAKAQRVLEAYSEQIVIQDADDIYVSDHQGTHSTSKSDQVQAGELLDMGTVLKASQVIASEIDLPQLIQKLMAIMLEHAGAQRGVLLLQGEQELEVTAVYQIDPAQLRQNLGPLKLHSSELPISLITQVLERNAPLVIQDALKEEPYKNELYIKQQKSKSILVMPLLHQQRLTGILYLENKLTSYVFTVHKLELLRLLSSQAVIALENALLFAKAQQISEELRLANEQLQVELIERAQAEEIQRRLQEEVIHAQKTALAELSTPLIPLSDQILIMPLIGTIDSQRAEQVMSTLLHGTQTFHVQVVIIDITGVPVVDTGVASSLIQSAQAIRLLGAQTFISGIRPEVAQTLVGLGVELSGIQTHGSLQQSISYAAHYVQTLAHNQGIGKQKSNSLSGLIPSKKAQSNGNGNGQTQFNGNGQLHTNGHVNGNGHANGNGNGHGQDAVRQEEQFELLKFPRKQSKN